MATDPNVNVTFGADTARLKAGLDEARRNLASFSNGAAGASANADALKASMDQLTSAIREQQAGWRDNLQAAANVSLLYVGLRTAVADYGTYGATLFTGSIAGAVAFDAALTAVTSGVNRAQQATAGFVGGLEVAAIQGAATAVQNGASSLVSYFTNAAYAERGARLFAVANDGVTASIGRSILGVGTYIDVLRLAYSESAKTQLGGISAAGGLDQFIGALNGANAKSALDSFTGDLMKIPGLTSQAASGIETMLATIPNYSTASNDILVNLLQTISKTGDDAIVNARKIADAFKDTKNGGSILGDLTGDLKNLDDIQILATRIASALQPSQASSYFDTIIAKIRQQAALQKTIADQNVAVYQSYGAIGSFLQRFDQERIDKAYEFNAASLVAVENLKLQKNALDAIVAAQSKEVDYQKLLNDEETNTSKLEQANENIASLKSHGQSRRKDSNDAEDDGHAEIKDSELDRIARTLIGEAGNQGKAGMEAVAAVIQNRLDTNYRGAASASDVVNAPKQFSVWNPGDAAGEMANRAGVDSPEYRQAMEIAKRMQSGDLDDPTSGATSYKRKDTSVRPGEIESNVTPIGDHRFFNTPDSPKVNDDDDIAKNRQRLEEQTEAAQKLTDTMAGGNAVEQASLAIAERNAAGAKDAVKDAQDELAAKRKILEQNQDASPTTKTAARKAVAEAEASLSAQEAARDKAENDLAIARTRDGSKERLDLTVAGLNAEQAKVADGSAKYIELEKQKYEATKKYNDAQRDEAASTEDAKFANLKRRAAEADDITHAKAKIGEISQAQERATLDASLAAQLAAQRAHFQALMALYADDPKQYRKYQQQLAEVDETNNAARIKNALAANEQIYASYKATFDRVGSTISSSLTAIIERTGTWRQLMQNIAKQVLSMFVDAGVKMVVDWAARQAASVAITVASETQKTTAVAAGEAARLGSVVSGAVASSAATAAAIFKNITASGAETFAGIFGFLAPVLGPAAAGPAAAGQAAVIATMPSFAVGAWSLPSDMVAQVHAGEMIVPAGPASAMRAAMSGGNNTGGGQGMGDVHFHIDGAKSPQETMAHITANLRTIQRMLNGQLANNPSLRTI